METWSLRRNDKKLQSLIKRVNPFPRRWEYRINIYLNLNSHIQLRQVKMFWNHNLKGKHFQIQYFIRDLHHFYDFSLDSCLRRNDKELQNFFKRVKQLPPLCGASYPGAVSSFAGRIQNSDKIKSGVFSSANITIIKQTSMQQKRGIAAPFL